MAGAGRSHDPCGANRRTARPVVSGRAVAQKGGSPEADLPAVLQEPSEFLRGSNRIKPKSLRPEVTGEFC
jgi:hypothetical protein